MGALLAAIAAYLIGSVSFAVVASRLFGLPDPRTYGSGNPGATNVLRTGRKAAALVTLLGDAAKGAVAVVLVRWLGGSDAAVAAAALAALCGHLYPVYFGFKGGKGVATAFGILLALSIWLGLVALSVFAGVLLATRYVSLASMLTAIVAALAVPLLLGWGWIAGAVMAMAGLVLWRHRTNLKRLLAGEESRLSLRRAPVPPAGRA